MREGASEMSIENVYRRRYVLAALLGAIVGGVVVARATKAFPKMMSQMMSGMMENMMKRMHEGGGTFPEMCQKMISQTKLRV